MTFSEIEALFAKTLAGAYDDEGPWRAVNRLRSSGGREVFDRAAAWCRSDDPLKRARAADVLCQLHRPRPQTDPVGQTEWLFRDESYSMVARMLENEREPLVLASAIAALGHLGNSEAVPLILRYQDHFDEDVRSAVTFALGSFPDEDQSVAGLLKLSRDPDDDVRDRAVFGLRVVADLPEIREALLRCLDDPNDDVREHAAIGLGKRRLNA